MKLRRLLAAGLVAWVLTACGTGILPGAPGPGRPDPDDPEPPTGFGATATALLTAVNEARASGATCGSKIMPPVPALTLDARLVRAAEVHSQDMADTKEMRHEGSDGSRAGDRITKEGYAWSTWGENVAWGQGSVQGAMQAWLKSAGHCENIMNANYTQLGAAGVNNYWTQVFARPR